MGEGEEGLAAGGEGEESLAAGCETAGRGGAEEDDEAVGEAVEADDAANATFHLPLSTPLGGPLTLRGSGGRAAILGKMGTGTSSQRFCEAKFSRHSCHSMVSSAFLSRGPTHLPF